MLFIITQYQQNSWLTFLSSIKQSMSQNSFDNQEIRQKFLIITFRKLIVKVPQLNNTKIIALVKVNPTENDNKKTQFQRGCYQISQPRTIKNNLACFYGESITIGQNVKNFCIQILGESGGSSRSSFGRLLLNVPIDNQKVNQLQKKKDVFSICSQLVQLVCEAQIKQNNEQKVAQGQDTLLEDFPETNNPCIEQEQKGRKIYSPAVRGELRRKKQSFRFKNKEMKSELMSQSPNKLTMDTNETAVKVRNKVRLASPPNIKNENCLKQFRIQLPKNNIQVEQKNEEPHERVGRKFEHPVLSLEKNPPRRSQRNTEKINIKYQSPSTPQMKRNKKNPMNFRKSEKLLDKFSFKSLIYTSVIGIIGGVAAAQF